MYIQEISIEIKKNVDRDELVDEFGILMSSYRKSGQTQGKIESQYINEHEIVCLPYTLEKDSLDEKYNNFYVTRGIKKVEEICGSKFEIKLVGQYKDDFEPVCKCKKSEYYILITNYLSISSPITCGTCNNYVPLYRLPVYEDHGYVQILNWETNYISCDSLQMNCQVGERWALNQMQEIASQLSKQGFNICRKIEELTNTPTYYYLHNYNKRNGYNLSRPCPSCGENWGVKESVHDYFDFKCDNCKILSTLSMKS